MVRVPGQFFFAFGLPAALRAVEPNPPTWPDSVKVFGPESSKDDITKAVLDAYAKNGGQNENGQFSSDRYAFLFKPGNYDVDVPVGYYTQVAGLGYSPTEVVFTSSKGVYCEEANYLFEVGALDTFWRAAENFQTNADYDWNGGATGMMWAASQAAPVRSVVIKNDLSLAEYVSGAGEGYSSGGFMANVIVNGTVHFGSQQQFMTRSSTLNASEDGVFNMVFVGTEGAPSDSCGAPFQYVTVDKTPKVAEKPYIMVDEQGSFSLNVPLLASNTVGAKATPSAVSHPFEGVYVARADVDTAATINKKLDEELHVVLSAGIYELDAPLQVNHPNTVILGLGLATLVSMNGTAVITVGNVPGVHIAGVLLQAGPEPTEVLLDWGEGVYPGDAENPGMLHDIFARVGGPSSPAQQQAEIMVRINSGNVIGDNLWLWRADHYSGGETILGQWPVNHGIVVNGDDVTMYGLAAEHTLQDIVQWNGERGATYFFQSELPYDVTGAYGTEGYVGYRVGSHVKEHSAYGVGVYHFFKFNPVLVQSGISVPPSLARSIRSPLSVYLGGEGSVQHVINDLGGASHAGADAGAVAVWYCRQSAAVVV